MRYIIDGYNLLFQIPFSSLEKTRTEILRVLREQSEYIKEQMIIVFDGQNKAPDIVRTHMGKLEVIYTAKNQTADQLIVDELLCLHAHETTLVTSDKGLAKKAQEKHVRTLSIKQFLQFLEKRFDKANATSEKPDADSALQKKRLSNIFEKKLSE